MHVCVHTYIHTKPAHATGILYTLNSNTIILLSERQINGEVFLDLSTEDIASILPQGR